MEIGETGLFFDHAVSATTRHLLSYLCGFSSLAVKFLQYVLAFNMKWKMLILIILLVSSFSPSSSQEQNDKECQDSYSCTPNENCQFYQEQISELTRSKVIETKNKILTTLRYL